MAALAIASRALLPSDSAALATPAPAPAQHRSGEALDLGIGIGIGVFFFLLLAALVIAQSLKKLQWRAALRSVLTKLGWKGRVQAEDSDRTPELKLSELKLPTRYTYRQLSAATKGFGQKELIGRGGFGEVFKGRLVRDGPTVAVKRMFEQSALGERQFLAEMAVVGRISHRNIVQLQGWCFEKGKMLLVYEYMPNGSLDAHLLPAAFAATATVKKFLPWRQRYVIAKGITAGLFYLHEGSDKKITHNDVKASNVLLDSDFNPRVADFGLAQLLDDDQLAKTMTVAGTLGYVAPELLFTGKANEKSDVYSFGILLLVIACGRSPLDETLPDKETLLNWVWRVQEESRLLDAADPKLSGDYCETEMECLLKLGLICCYPDPDSRPTMRFCNQVLLGDAPVPRVAISKPLLFPSMHSQRTFGEFRSSDTSFNPRFSEFSTAGILPSVSPS